MFGLDCRTVVHLNGDCKDNIPSCVKFIELQRAVNSALRV